jgi:hypothetical protein
MLRLSAITGLAIKRLAITRLEINRAAVARALAAMCVGAVGACAQPIPARETEPAPPSIQTSADLRCPDANDKEYNLYWGDLHVHTSYSLDAYVYGTAIDPASALAFARGAAIIMPDGVTRKQIDRPLDFMALTDHAETFDVMYLCTEPTHADKPYCARFRGLSGTDSQNSQEGFRSFLLPIIAGAKPAPSPLCSEQGVDCEAAARAQWLRVQEHANKANDPCSFTSFIGSEWSATPDNRHWHRNLIYANDRVPAMAIDYVRYPSVDALWTALDENCRAEDGCDVLAIPHNTNLAEGGGFDVEESSTASWTQRARYEKLIEIFQSKGQSECLPETWDNNDADCGFEVLFPPAKSVMARNVPAFYAEVRRSYARSLLGIGLKSYAEHPERRLNPLQLGFIGSTDTHSASPGDVAESNWKGDAWSAGDLFRERRLQRPDYNPGGLVGVWARQNTRADVFAALKARRTYATSGPRITLRFFAQAKGAGNLCRAGGNETAVMMGGQLSKADQSPRFAVLAMQDQTPLSRIEIVKGSLKDDRVLERVLTLRADDDGFSQACIEWTDPDFDPKSPAYWYARISQTPTPRWSQIDCRAMGVCDQNPSLDRTIRERAWSSPIWYLP